MFAMQNNGNGDEEGDPYDINGAHFNPDMYLQKLIKDSTLPQLMERESDIIKQIQSLDSDMQTLVYENYNKFISATDTIRKMKNDFKKMEEEMDLLATNMGAITSFSAQISETLQDRRQKISKLSGVHSLLKKLQFLFELPTKLKSCLEECDYVQAVKYFTRAQKVLLQYQHMPSFRGIQEDCNHIVSQIKERLREQVREKEVSPHQLAQAVDLLLQLGEPGETLCDDFLSHARQRLEDDLDTLEKQLKLRSASPEEKLWSGRPSSAYQLPVDILEFIDLGCNGFLGDICLVVASYNDVFISRAWVGDRSPEESEHLETVAVKKLINFVMHLMERYFHLVESRLQLEKEPWNTTQLVKALDRFHRRLQAMSKLLPQTDFARTGLSIVSKASRDQSTIYLQVLQECFEDTLTEIKQSLLSPKAITQDGEANNALSEQLTMLVSSVADRIKSILSEMQNFIQVELTFALKVEFRQPFCTRAVREDLIVAYLDYLMDRALEMCNTKVEKDRCPPELLLLLSRFCLDMSTSTIHFLMNTVEEQFSTLERSQFTPLNNLCSRMHDVAQQLVDHYVRVQGLTLSQMLRKSVETRDWLHTIEPRTVRAVMKRVVEDVTSIDMRVGALYEEGQRREERSSDSSRRTFFGAGALGATGRHQSGVGTAGGSAPSWSGYAPSQMDTSLATNIQKLFSERIEIFGSVQFNKVSILTGIIKISLKTFLECVRLRTFSRFGLQQVQVDTHYLQLYLWRFVSDENLVHTLLDEIVGSVIHRCLDPVLMEHSVVKLIAERG